MRIRNWIATVVLLSPCGCDRASADDKPSAQSADRSPVIAASVAPKPTKVATAAYEAAGVTFHAAEALPKKEDIGGQGIPATEFVIDDDKNLTFRVVLSEFPVGAGGPAQEGDVAGMMMMGRSTYLASSKPAESKVERTILGKKTTGDKSRGTIPRPTVSEAYVIERAPKNYVFLGFKYDESFNAQRAETLIESICSSLAVRK
jgi:hypothetical protein